MLGFNTYTIRSLRNQEYHILAHSYEKVNVVPIKINAKINVYKKIHVELIKRVITGHRYICSLIHVENNRNYEFSLHDNGYNYSDVKRDLQI